MEAIEHICRAERSQSAEEFRGELDAARTAIDKLELEHLEKLDSQIRDRAAELHRRASSVAGHGRDMDGGAIRSGRSIHDNPQA